MTNNFQGIEGLGQNAGSGRNQAWGAVITIGTKDPNRGNPSQTDKFFVKKPHSISKKIGSRSVIMREPDPDFERYNQSNKPALRQTIRFYIVHPSNLNQGWDSMIDSFQFQLKAYQLPKHKMNPNKIPTCMGNGKNAKRWDGKEFQEIKCPNHLCEFRQGKPAPCKPFARLAFQLRWEEDKPWAGLPTPLVKFETHSWYNIDKVIIPFFAGLHKQALALGAHNYNLYGLPCAIKLGKRQAAGNLVPAISIATDFPPGINLQQFFLNQQQLSQQIKQLQITEEDYVPSN